MRQPLAIDLFCGLGGWTEGLLACGYRVVGFDVERHVYPRRVIEGNSAVKRPGMDWSDRSKRGAAEAQFNRPAPLHPDGGVDEYPGELVLQDVLTIHGSQFRNADLIVASPPCQEFSYMAMPWSRAKQIAAALRGQGEFPEGYTGSRTTEQLTALFDACFRIQREASEAGGRHIPMVVENVRGAQPWVGRAPWNYGSFYLWGDVPALMPRTVRTIVKAVGHANKRDGHTHTRHLTNQRESDAVKQHGSGAAWFDHGICSHSSKSLNRKAASAQIAKIPFDLARHIGMVYLPTQNADVECVDKPWNSAENPMNTGGRHKLVSLSQPVDSVGLVDFGGAK